MMPSAIDQRTIVLAKRKIKTERGVDGFGAATCSSVSAIRCTIRNDFSKGKALLLEDALTADDADCTDFLMKSLFPSESSAKPAVQERANPEQDCAILCLNYSERREQNDAGTRKA